MTKQTHTDIHSAALSYAAQGIPTFPCVYGKKTPAVKGGFKAATTDPARIDKWFKNTNYNIGIPTGKISGFVVIDNDCYKPGAENSLTELEKKYGKLPPTYTVKTRAGGYQYYFKYPAGSNIRNSTGALTTGIDIRGEGGYVIAPPSWVDKDDNGPAGFYEVINDVPAAELPLDWITALQNTSSKAQKKTASKVGQKPSALAFLAGFILPDNIPKGTRNTTLLKYAGHLRGTGVKQSEIDRKMLEVNNTHCEEPLGEDELLKIACQYENQGVDEVVSIDKTGWPEPQEIDNPLPPVPAFDVKLLPSALRPWIADIADRMQCPPAYLAVGAMVAAGAVIGNRVGIQPKKLDTGWTEVANLWGAIVGRPGVMKTPALSQVLTPLKQLEAQALAAFSATQAQYEIDLMQYDFDKKKVAEQVKKGASVQAGQMPIRPEEPQPPRLLVNDSTYQKLGEVLNGNPHGVLTFQDELSGLLQRLDNSGQEAARAFYLEAWDGKQSYTFDRIGRGTVSIPRLCFSLLGGLQPSKLSQYLRSAVYGGSGDDGLAQRLQMLVYPDIDPEFTNVDRRPDHVATEAAFKVFDRLYALDPVAIGAKQVYPDAIPVFRFTDKAQNGFNQWRRLLEIHLRKGDNHAALESHISKYRKLVPAIAMLDHLIKGKSGNIGLKSLMRAIAWQKYLFAHAKRCYAAVTSATMDSALALSKHITRGALKDGFTVRDVYRKNWSMLGSVKEAAEAVEVLVDLGWLRTARDEQTVSHDGRPTVRYFINPRLKEDPQ